MKLYDYWRSGASFRVRIAANLKGIELDLANVHLVKDGGEQHSDAYAAINPQKLVPALDTGAGIITQSLAMIEYLDEKYPDPPLLPGTAEDRARIRAMAYAIAVDCHPIQNLRVLNRLKAMGHNQDEVNAWGAHWIELAFSAVEGLIARAPKRGAYCYGDEITMADVVLAPQMLNAVKFGADISRFPTVVEIVERLMALPAFEKAHPSNHPNAEA